jgi:hypothetical protein
MKQSLGSRMLWFALAALALLLYVAMRACA